MTSAMELEGIPVLVLAGGAGTRLRPVYPEGPKILAPVNGKPFLSYLLRQLATGGLRDVILCVGYKGEQVREYAGDGRAFGIQISYSAEDEPLGTGGALRQAAELRKESARLFAVNGDSYVGVDFAAMYLCHLSRGARATVALTATSDASRYGVVTRDADGWVSGFCEKTQAAEKGSVNAGVYLMNAELIHGIQNGRAVSLEREVLPKLCGRGLDGFQTDGYFVDIGIPADYVRAQTEFQEMLAL